MQTVAARPESITVSLPPKLPWQHRLFDAWKSDARFIVAVMGRRAGKTHAAAELAGLAMLAGKNIMWGAPTYDIAAIGQDLFRRMWRPVIVKMHTTPSPNAQLINGSRIIWRSFDRSGASIGRGFDLVIIDEAARVRRRIVYEEVLPTIADTGGKIVAITTPRGQRNWVYDWHLRAAAEAEHYTEIRGPSTENPMPAVQEFVEVARREMPENLFRQEFLAEFVEDEGSVFRRIRDGIRPGGWHESPPDGAQCVIGCDLAKHEDWTVLLAMDTKTGNCLAMDRFRRIDWTLIIERIKQFCTAWGGTMVIDSTGVGDPIFDQLAAAGVPVMPFKFTEQTKSSLVVALATALEKKEISYPADEVLLGELESYTYEQLPSGRFRYNAPEGQHDDCVMALALANWGRVRGGVLEGSGWI